MGSSISLSLENDLYSFSDVQEVLEKKPDFLVINTLLEKDQDILLPNTCPFHLEEKKINDLLQDKRWQMSILVYGRNSRDMSSIKKREQLKSLGFQRVYVYTGGIFEWLLLQEIYGIENFPTTKKENDLLRFQ